MPVIGEQVTLAYKLLPLSLYPDGTASITVRRGMLHEDGTFEAISEKTVLISQEETSAVLDAEPVSGLTRRDDLSFAVYQYLVSKGEVAGTVI